MRLKGHLQRCTFAIFLPLAIAQALWQGVPSNFAIKHKNRTVFSVSPVNDTCSCGSFYAAGAVVAATLTGQQLNTASLVVQGPVSVTGNLTVDRGYGLSTGHLVTSGTAVFGGRSTFSANVSMTANAQLNIAGLANLQALNVAGRLVVGGSASVAGGLAVSGGLNVTAGDVAIRAGSISVQSGGLTVAGALRTGTWGSNNSRTIYTTDPRPTGTNCVPLGAEDTPLFGQTFTLVGPAHVHVFASMIRQCKGQTELTMYVDGVPTSASLAYTSELDWAQASLSWGGVLNTGSHSIDLRATQCRAPSNTVVSCANIWGCSGSSKWNYINTLILG